MRLKIIYTTLLSVFLLFQVNTSANDSLNYKTLLKTNLLNSIYIPSVHLERQIGKDYSLQLDLHPGYFHNLSDDLFVFDGDYIFTSSINFRKYWLKKRESLQQLYTSAGVGGLYGLNHKLKEGKLLAGANFRIGSQLQIGSSNWHLDFNLGFAGYYRKKTTSVPGVVVEETDILKTPIATFGVCYQISMKN